MRTPNWLIEYADENDDQPQWNRWGYVQTREEAIWEAFRRSRAGWLARVIHPFHQLHGADMSTHQGLPVAGYLPQSQERVDLVNANKQEEELLLRLVDELRKTDADQRWLAVAKTHFEEGFMAMNRAIFQPARIKLDGEE